MSKVCANANCGAENNAQDMFCFKCGTRLPAGEEAAEEESRVACGKCGVSNEADCKFCMGCGGDLQERKGETAEEGKEEKRKKERKKKRRRRPPGVKRKTRGKLCPSPDCELPNPRQVLFCRGCGTKFDASTVEEERKPPALAVQGVTNSPTRKPSRSAVDAAVGSFLDKAKQPQKPERRSRSRSKNRSRSPRRSLQTGHEMQRQLDEEAAREKAAKKTEKAAKRRALHMKKLFVIQEDSIHAKNSLLQVLLKPGTVAIVDAVTKVFVWDGGLSSKSPALKFAMELAKVYVAKANAPPKKEPKPKPPPPKKEKPVEQGKAFLKPSEIRALKERQAREAEEEAARQKKAEEKRKKREKRALERMRNLPPPVRVRKDKEPYEFTQCFQGWKDTAARKVTRVRDPSPVVTPATPATPATPTAKGEGPVVAVQKRVLDLYNPIYSLEQLQDRASLPPTLDFSRLETYLDDPDFYRLFGMTLDVFERQAPWKKSKLKKSVGLF